MRDPFKITQPTCISFSGGRTSAYMLWRVLQANGGLPADSVVCFANTGKEVEATLRFVRDCAEHWQVPIRWLEYLPAEPGFTLVDFDRASRQGEPVEALIRKRQYLPNPVARGCTTTSSTRVSARLPRSDIGCRRWLALLHDGDLPIEGKAQMPRDMQVDSLREGLLPLRNWDMPIRLYHDETNNIRRLTLSELGLNVPDNKTFVIGGVALLPCTEIVEWPQLRQLLRMQPSATEIKFEHLAKGSYEEVLGSRKLASFLQWLLDQNMMVHYSALDPLYWSILDIIESLQADDRFQINECHMELKTELHHSVMQDSSGFLALLHGFGYPNVLREQVRSFMEAVLEFVNGHVPQDRSAATWVLRQTLRRAERLTDLELAFLHDNEPGELISDFSIQFLYRIYVFKNASHVFDEETYVEKILSQLELREGERRLDYRFADSKAEVGIQLSDVVAGLVGRHFSYLKDHSLKELMQRRAGFTELQLANLARLRTLVDRSDAFSDGLLHVLMPLDTCFKNNAFLHEVEVPPFMWA